MEYNPIVKLAAREVYNRMESAEKSTGKKRNAAYDITVVAISAALITVCSWISIPLGPVPVTLQTLAILAVLLTAGGRRGTLAIVVYLALGAVGVPVFSGFKREGFWQALLLLPWSSGCSKSSYLPSS